MIKLSVEVHRLHKNDNNVFELAFPLSLLTLSKDINLCRRQWQNQVNAWNHYKKTLKVRNLYFYDKAVVSLSTDKNPFFEKGFLSVVFTYISQNNRSFGFCLYRGNA